MVRDRPHWPIRLIHLSVYPAIDPSTHPSRSSTRLHTPDVDVHRPIADIRRGSLEHLQASNIDLTSAPMDAADHSSCAAEPLHPSILPGRDGWRQTDLCRIQAKHGIHRLGSSRFVVATAIERPVGGNRGKRRSVWAPDGDTPSGKSTQPCATETDPVQDGAYGGRGTVIQDCPSWRHSSWGKYGENCRQNGAPTESSESSESSEPSSLLGWATCCATCCPGHGPHQSRPVRCQYGLFIRTISQPGASTPHRLENAVPLWH
jgi:hypothetical protein